MDWRPLSLAFLVDFSAVLFPPVLAKAGVDWWNASNTVILALLVFAGLTFAAVGVVWKGEMSTGGAALFAIFGLFLGILTLLSIWFAANTQGSAYLSCLAIKRENPPNSNATSLQIQPE